MFGGKGDDTLIGGKGEDEFVFTSGNDVITDFNVSKDELELDDIFEDVSPSLADTDNGLIITFTEKDSLLLVGLSEANFPDLDDLFD